MSSNDHIQGLGELGDFIRENQGKLTINSARKLIFDGTPQLGNLANFGVTVEQDSGDIVINIGQISAGNRIIFESWIDQDLNEGLVDSSIVFISLSGNIVHYDGTLCRSINQQNEFKKSIESVIGFYRILGVMSQNDINDHHNVARRELVFYSSTVGVVKINYPAIPPRTLDVASISSIPALITTFSDPRKRIFLINAIPKVSSTATEADLPFLITHGGALIQTVNRDYELHLKQFDFDTFKDHLLKEKDRYFNSIREIISKIFSQLIGIPISISASVFATYKVESEPMTILLILIGFLFYLIIYVKIQMLYKVDLADIKTEFERDFEIIKSKSGLEPKTIDIERKSIEKKIKKTTAMVKFMIYGIIGLGATFLLYLADAFSNAMWKFSIWKWILTICQR